jgi:hypothetical protein
MRNPNTLQRLARLAICAAGVFLFALPLSSALAQNPLNPEAVTARQLPGRMGSLSCASATCHGRLEPRAAVSGMARQEFIHWTTADPHARAGARILEKPFQDVLNRLVKQYAPSNPTPEQKAEIRTEVYQQCAACHDEAGKAELARRSSAEPQLKLDDFEDPKLAHGIDCESCHGGSERWLAVHYQAWVPKAMLLEMGMVDTDDLVGRAKQCTSCHVGGPGKDMNHDMIAAGHPPLRFELSAYHAVIQRKHWDERKVRQLNPDYDIHLWQAGQWATAKATAELLAERAKKAQANHDPAKFTFPAPWPEFAEYNCFSCHQQLRSGAEELWTKRPTDRRGVPAWGGWNTLPLELFVGRNSSILPEPANESPLFKIQTQMAPFVGVELERTKTVADEALTYLRNTAVGSGTLSLTELLSGTVPLQTQDVAPPRIVNPTWEAVSHRYLLLASVFRALRDKSLDQSFTAAPIGAVKTSTVIDPALSAMGQRLSSIRHSLGFIQHDSEWPIIYSSASGDGSSPTRGDAVQQSARDVAENLNEILAALKVTAGHKD